MTETTVSGSVRAHIVLVHVVLVFLSKQHGQLTDSARNKKRLAPRLERSIRKQLVINRAQAGHFSPFKHPHVTRSPPIGIAKLSEVFMNFSSLLLLLLLSCLQQLKAGL